MVKNITNIMGDSIGDSIGDRILNILIFLILTIYMTGYFKIRYFSVLPTISVYPDNNIEILEVKSLVNENNQYYIELFKKTDKTVRDAFKEIVDLDPKQLDNIILSPHLIIITLILKTIFNRARPKQIDVTLDVQNSDTANTPAYPSGHCIQAYYLAKKLSVIYPNRSDEFYKLAEECALSRVYAGLHYMSDNNFGKYIAINIL